MTGAREPELSSADVLGEAIIVDTDAYSKVFLAGAGRAGRPERAAERRALVDALTGKTVLIALQTRAELLTFPAMGKLGERRAAEVRRQIDRTPTVPVTAAVVDAWVGLTVDCRLLNHPLGYKAHAADRWVAATAMALAVPLLAVDAGYKDTPGLTLLSW